jgi:hypothetical protein
MRQQIVTLPFCSAASMMNRRHLATTAHSLENLPSALCVSMSIVSACVCCRSVVDPSWTMCLKLAVPSCSQCTRLSAVLCYTYTLLRGIALESTASLPWDGYRHSVGSLFFQTQVIAELLAPGCRQPPFSMCRHTAPCDTEGPFVEAVRS